MTLLELAQWKEKTIQAVCDEIKQITGIELPCTRNYNVADSIIKKYAPNILDRKGKTEKEDAYVRRKENRKKGQSQETNNDLELLNSNDNIITTVRQVLSDCVIVDFITGGTLILSKSLFKVNYEIQKGNIVELSFTDSTNPNERFDVINCRPKVEWQQKKIISALESKELLSGKILYPYKDLGYFVNIFGVRAIMFNNQISDQEGFDEGSIIKVAVASADINGTSFKVNVSQKLAESIARTSDLLDAYNNLFEGEYIDTIIDKIEEKYILVKYEGLSCIIYKEDLFWCYVRDINNHLDVGMELRAKVVSKEIVVSKENKNKKFNIRLSHKEFAFNPWSEDCNYFMEGEQVCGPITGVYDKYYTIKIADGVEGTLHANNMTRLEFESLKQWTTDMDDVNVIIKSKDAEKKRIELSTITLDEAENVWDNMDDYYKEDNTYKGVVVSIDNDILWVELQEGIEASINKNEICWPKSLSLRAEDFSVGEMTNILITKIDRTKRRIYASIKQLIPNPWELANASMETGETCKVEVIERKEKILIVETLDNFHLIGVINISELSWFPLKHEEEPQIGEELKAKVMVFQPEKYILKLSVRQLQEDPWNDLYLGAEVKGTIQTRTDPAFINVLLANKLLAKTPELKFLNEIGNVHPFKIVSCNRATQEIIVSNDVLLYDQQNEEVVKLFFNAQY